MSHLIKVSTILLLHIVKFAVLLEHINSTFYVDTTSYIITLIKYVLNISLHTIYYTCIRVPYSIYLHTDTYAHT